MAQWITFGLLVMLSNPAFCNQTPLLSFLSTPPPKTYSVPSLSLSPSPTSQPINKKELGCGWRHVDGMGGFEGRMTGMDNANFGEFPWVVAIFKYSNATNSYKYCCVGSLIHNNVVLTVKHHFKRPERIRVRAGDWDLAEEIETHLHQSSDVTRVMHHPGYKARTNEYDAALLILSTPITLAPNVAIACLPPVDLVTPPGTSCAVAGWGNESANSTVETTVLKMITVPVVDFNVCNRQLQKVIPKRFNFSLSPSMMCAGGEEGEDACVKDGGAPLVCPYSVDSTRYYQAGIVSWGIGCGDKDVPGVYTSVAKVRQWIDDTMATLGYGSSQYTP